MGVLRHRRRHNLSTFTTAFTFLLFASASAISLSQLGNGFEEREEKELLLSGRSRWVLTQKRLGGPGSSPPTCRSKCGWCSPCKPVRVSIQPGLTIPLEYYPEAWRCKCGNKLFMP
ncbi:hypothetical protein ACFE04_007810 [Oxalis oulophora]